MFLTCCTVIALFFLWFVIAEGSAINGSNLYVSHASGNDSWSCDQSKPCKSIWRAVTLASHGDRIHLDGTNTDKDPYTCQSGTSEHPGIYISKSLSLIGYASLTPQIRCSEGTGLTFNNSDNVEQMNVTLSGLLVNESFMSVQDSSVNINGCKFEGSKQGGEFVLRNKMASNIRITNSTFYRNRKCISVVVNSTNKQPNNIQIVFKLLNSSFHGNLMSDEGSGISFTESAHSKQSVSCDITLENVTFSRNKFRSRGLVFIEINHGKQNIHLQNVSFVDNSPSLGRHVLTGDGDSECMVDSSTANIVVDSCNVRSQNARSFNVSASYISLQIYNSSFFGHRVKGKGGVISLRGTDLCNLDVSNSSFINTTAAQGGAINIECTNIYSVSLQDSIFTDNTARNGGGGAVYIDALGSFSSANNSEYATNAKANLDYKSQSAEQTLQINITKSDFTNSYSSSSGGALFIRALYKASMRLYHSAFVNCAAIKGSRGRAEWGGGGVFINTRPMSPKETSGSDFVLIVESSRFIRCSAGNRSGFGNGGSLNLLYKTQVEIYINNSRFVSNHAVFGGTINVCPPSNLDRRWLRRNGSFLSIERSTFSKNSAGKGGAIYLQVSNQSTVILQNVTMESNIAEFSGGAVDVGPNALPTPFTLKIHQSRFLNNTAREFGGAISLNDVTALEMKDSLLDSNSAWNDFLIPDLSGRGALYIKCRLISTSIVISNTAFKNCSARLQGGAIFMSHEGNVSLEVKKSRFLENFVFPGELGQGGGMLLSMSRDIETNRKCMREGLASANYKIDDDNEFHSWVYKSHLIFEDTSFERNAGDAGGAVHLTNGKATFRNCSFIDNFAGSLGGHIYTVAGSSSLIIQDSLFRQTMNQLQRSEMTYTKPSFIHSESSGKLNVFNTAMNATSFSDQTSQLILVRNGRQTDFGKNNLTTVYCPVGSQMEIVQFTDQVATHDNLSNKSCEINVTILELSCSACAANFYSLQRGRAIGSRLVPGFQCLPCPFGANCSRDIHAKPNFWGFSETANPLALKFTKCPLGYCRPPETTVFPEYNGCQGNRSGELCGQCNDAYTETLYSANCRPSHECKDYWFWFLALGYISIMAFYFTFQPPILPWIKRQILWFKKHEPTNEDNDFDRGYLKIIFHFYQAANLLLVSNSSQHIFKTKFIDIFVGLFNFQQKFSSSGLICPFPGLTVVTKQLFSVSHVCGTLFIINVFYLLHWGIQKYRGQGVPSFDPYMGGILQTVLLGYTTKASVTFNLLRCVPIGSEKRLFYDGNVVCLQWWQHILIAIVYTFFVPFVFVLFWGSFKLYSGNISPRKFLLACSFPLPSLLYWAFVFLLSKLSSVARKDSPPSRMSRSSVERVLYDSFKRPEEGGRKLSLSWESVMIGRRLILIVLKTFVTDPMPRLLIMSLFCFLSVVHHIMTQPFRDAIANTVETISLMFLVVLAVLNVFFASFISLAVPLNDHFSSWWNVCQVVEIVVLCAVPAVFVLLVVAAILSQVCRLIVVVYGCLWRNFCLICFKFCRSSKNVDERKCLLSVGSTQKVHP